MTQKIGILLLAAGNSSRYGAPKQRLAYQGKTLLSHLAQEASAAANHQLLIVLGASHEAIQEDLAGSNYPSIYNPQWATGMASSIRLGMETLLQSIPEMEQCIICVCDQPYINSSLFESLKSLQAQSGKGLVATGFADTWGVPVLFTKPYFQALQKLEGQQGARKIIQQQLEDLAIFPFPAAATDIDTPADYQRLIGEFITVEQAQEIIRQHMPAKPQLESVSLLNAAGYKLGKDVYASQDIPLFAQSSMDGYAIRYGDIAGGKIRLRDHIPAGSKQQKTLETAEAMRIFTGAPLPAGADTILMQEYVSLDAEGYLQLAGHEINRGDHVRPQGAEVAAGALAMAAGTLLSPAAIGYLAGIGCEQVSIISPPRIALILTGDELSALGKPLSFGEVYESNSYQLQAACKQWGVKNISCYLVKDDVSALQHTIEKALAEADILLLVGGVSVGDYDFVLPACKAAGISQAFHRIRQKPGKPLFFGFKGEKLIFGLPGNPSSALSCFYLYVAPVLENSSQAAPRIQRLDLPITHSYKKKAGLSHFLKGHFNGREVQALHAQESYRLQSYAQANCLIHIPQECEYCSAGTLVTTYLLPT